MNDVRSDETSSRCRYNMNTDESPLFFDKIYYETALIGKMMDVRRYDYGQEPPSVGMTQEVRCHAMPFLRRNLSYILEGTERWKKRKRKRLVAERNSNPRKRKRRDRLTTNTLKEADGRRILRYSKPNAIAMMLQSRFRIDRKAQYVAASGAPDSLDLLWRYYKHRPRTHASPDITSKDGTKEEKQPPNLSLVPSIELSSRCHKDDVKDKGGVEGNETLSLRGIERKQESKVIDIHGDVVLKNGNFEAKKGEKEGHGACKHDESSQRKLRTRTRSSAVTQNKSFTKPDRKFPLYKPFDGWKWRQPAPARSAYQLFCEWRTLPLKFEDMGENELQLVSLSKELRDFVEEKELRTMWKNINVGEYLYFMQEELWDKERYLHHLCTYNNARKGISMSSSELRAFVRSELNYRKSHSSGPKRLSPVTFHYLHHCGDDTIVMQRETRRDRKCPFCLFDGKNERSLLLHCNSMHDKLSFSAGYDEANVLHVVVRKRKYMTRRQTESKTVCSLESKRLRQNVDIQFIPKPFEKSAFLDPVAKKSKVKLLERMIETKKGSVHPFAISQYRPSAKAPIRQYYHGRTNQPINSMEWQDDSDDEYDQEWIHKLGERLLHELDDVAVNEKRFMKLWNRFIRSDAIIRDSSIPEKCREFVISYHLQITECDLRGQLLLHLFNLWDNRVLPSYAILNLMNEFDKLSMERV